MKIFCTTLKNMKIKGDRRLKLREFNFNEIPAKGLSIFVNDKEVAMGFIGEVLKEIPHLADYEIKETNYYMDTFVIRL